MVEFLKHIFGFCGEPHLNVFHILLGTPAISYIIESYPKTVEFVITLGHFGDHVKEFLELAYPDRKFQFVWVDVFSGKGSSLVYSMLQTKNHLQCPFIFHACDN